MPAIKKHIEFKVVGYGINSVEERYPNWYDIDKEILNRMLKEEEAKVQRFVAEYGGEVFYSYMELITSNKIDAVYIPLPPALHYKWARLALEYGKHVFIEKPCTLTYQQTKELGELALSKNLGFHENYMFIFHNQLQEIYNIIHKKALGDIRLYRLSFGFPRRHSKDFRYNRDLGGGALIDAGGYTIKYASMLLGEKVRILYSQMNYIEDFEVDIYGSGALSNEKGEIVQISYGMDNEYKCDLEVWGSKGNLLTTRILTAPDGFIPSVAIKQLGETRIVNLSSDDAFYKSIDKFYQTIINKDILEKNVNEIIRQARLVEDFRKNATIGGRYE